MTHAPGVPSSANCSACGNHGSWLEIALLAPNPRSNAECHDLYWGQEVPHHRIHSSGRLFVLTVVLFAMLPNSSTQSRGAEGRVQIQARVLSTEVQRKTGQVVRDEFIEKHSTKVHTVANGLVQVRAERFSSDSDSKIVVVEWIAN